MSLPTKPKGELVIRTIAMPADTNPNGDIFGGWLMSQMDLGSGILASNTAKARVVTVAMEGLSFLQPVGVGDTVACYACTHTLDGSACAGVLRENLRATGIPVTLSGYHLAVARSSVNSFTVCVTQLDHLGCRRIDIVDDISEYAPE